MDQIQVLAFPLDQSINCSTHFSRFPPTPPPNYAWGSCIVGNGLSQRLQCGTMDAVLDSLHAADSAIPNSAGSSTASGSITPSSSTFCQNLIQNNPTLAEVGWLLAFACLPHASHTVDSLCWSSNSQPLIILKLHLI